MSGCTPEDGDHPLQIVGENVNLRADLFEVRSLKWVALIHALMVPNGCSALWRRMRMVSSARSNRSCIASRTASCSQRWTRRSFAGVHFDFSAQPVHFIVQ